MTYFNELNLKMRDVFKRVCGYKPSRTAVEILKDGRFKSPVRALCATDDLADELLKLKIMQ